MISYKNETIKAISWSFGSKAFSQIVSVSFGIVLARLLSPNDFGLVAMPLVFMGFAGLFGDVGLGAALIQKKSVTSEHYSSVFWLNLSVASLLTSFFLIFASSIANFYDEPELESVVLVLSFNFIISALGLMPRIKFTKELKFKELGIIDLIAMIIANLAALSLAYLGYNYWALVVQIILIQFVSTSLVWRYSKWVPKYSFKLKLIRELFQFSLYVFLMNLLRYIATTVDKLLIGKFLSAGKLGLYDKAQSMMLFPIFTISHSIGAVIFPSFSNIQEDTIRIKKVYLNIIAAISFTTFPMLMGMIAVADSFVMGVLGEQWSQIIFLLRMFCAVGTVLSIVTITGGIYLSLGKAKLRFKVNVFTQSIQIVSLICGAPWGLEGIVIGYVASSLFGAIVTWKIAGSLIHTSLWEIFCALIPAFLISFFMMIIVWCTGWFLLSGLTFLGRFFVQIIIGGTIYLLLIFLIKPPICIELLNIIKSTIKKR